MNSNEPTSPTTPTEPETPEGPNLKFAAIASTVLLSVMLIAILFLRQTPQLAEQRSVLATIPPLHSLVSGVMAGVDAPKLLLPAGTSPHDHTLLPSENEAFYRAHLINWIDPAVETALPRMIDSLPNHVYLMQVGTLDGMTRLPTRRGGLWQDDHGDHGDETDPHSWLDPANAVVWVEAIANNLTTLDPENGESYRRNAAALTARLRDLDDELRERLAPFTGVPYLVYHDAYRYLEARYDLTPIGAFAVDADRPVSAGRLSELQATLENGGARCLFVEPQFKPRQVDRLVEATGVRVATLDPLGSDLAPGSDLYFAMMRNLANSLAGCLGGG
jgi:zinc transport system substrate-binding protein